MELESFKATLGDELPPKGLGTALQALWRDGKGDWDGAHELAQVTTGAEGAWVHAYLHRKEGDLENADYWYERAGKERPWSSLANEWDSIASALLAR